MKNLTEDPKVRFHEYSVMELERYTEREQRWGLLWAVLKNARHNLCHEGGVCYKPSFYKGRISRKCALVEALDNGVPSTTREEEVE